MRKTIACLLLQIIMISQAAAAQHTLEGTEITLSFPDDAYVVTPSTPLDDPTFSSFGISDPQEVVDYMKEVGILAEVLFDDITYEVIAGSPPISSSYTTSLSDFVDGSEEEMNELYDSLSAQFEDTQMTVNGIYLCRDFEYPFVVYDISQPFGETTAYSREYYTWVNNQALYVTLHNYSGEPVSVEQDRLLRSIVETVKFPTQAKPAAETQTIYEATQETKSSPDDYGILPRVLGGALMGAVFGAIGTAIARARRRDK